MVIYNKFLLEPQFLNYALEVATGMDKPFVIGKLLQTGATNFEKCILLNMIDKCIKRARMREKPNAHCMLLLLFAALTGNVTILQKLYREPAPNKKNSVYMEYL